MNRLFLVLLFITSAFYAQQAPPVDFTEGDIEIAIDPYKKEVRGAVEYKFLALNTVDSIVVNVSDIQILEVTLNRRKADFFVDKGNLIVRKKIKGNSENHVYINFVAHPKKAMYFMGWDGSGGRAQVWTQGQGKYTSNWLPSFDDMNEKVIFDLTITFPRDFEVMANGRFKDVKENGRLKTWSFDMEKPMSSYLLAITAGKFQKTESKSASGIPLRLYYYPDAASEVEPTYRYTKEIFDFLEAETGVSYPWGDYKQVPVRDFLYAGMENTGLTIFSDSFLTDSLGFKDRNYVNVNAHEMAHQWFGNLVTEVSGKHHWLQEGFATYYAYLSEKHLFGEDHYYWLLFQTYSQLKTLSEEGKGERLTDPAASSLTFYEKGAWALHMLSEEVGAKAFKAAVKAYLLKYQFKNATIDNFLVEVEQSSGKDLSSFKNRWLDSPVFPIEETVTSLQKNNFAKKMLEFENGTAPELNSADFKPFMFSDMYYPARQQFVFEVLQKQQPIKQEVIKTVLDSKDVHLRQALAIGIDTIPPSMKIGFEGLLHDPSYTTIENALFKLWNTFPENRFTYLDQTKNIIGFSNHNIRILWLALAMITPGYSKVGNMDFYKELTSYTGSDQNIETRQNAFQFMYRLQVFSNESLKDLVQASMHHTWQFSKFSRDLMDELLKEEGMKVRFERIFSELSDSEKVYLKKRLNGL